MYGVSASGYTFILWLRNENVILSTSDSRTLVKRIPETLLALELVTLRTVMKTVSDILKVCARQVGVGQVAEGGVSQERVEECIVGRVHTLSSVRCLSRIATGPGKQESLDPATYITLVLGKAKLLYIEHWVHVSSNRLLKALMSGIYRYRLKKKLFLCCLTCPMSIGVSRNLGKVFYPISVEL